jgi:cytochrome o ubiquinol oxidase subunit 1
MVIALGIGFQLLQLVVSIKQRKANMDTTGDPWNGRTLEWSNPSPAPVYNFATLDPVHDRDAWWAAKQKGTAAARPARYEDIEMPRGSGMGLLIAGCAFIFGFAVIWHIWWLAVIGLLGVITSVIVRSLNEDTEYTIPAAEVGRAA